MSEPTPRAPGSHPADAPADDALAAMNDHLARFFQHADTLLRDWQAYGDKLRRSIDGEVGQLGDKVARAVAEAGRNAASQLDSRVERGVADSLASLRRELDGLARLANQTGARSQHPGRQGSTAALESPRRAWTSPVFWALVVANIMLAVLIAASARDCQARSESGPGAAASEVASDPAGAAVSDPAGTPADPGATGDREAAGGADGGTTGGPGEAGDAPVAAMMLSEAEADKMCQTLATGYDPAAAEILLGAAIGAACGERADAVENVLFERLTSEPGDAGAKRSLKPASKRSSKPASKKSSKPASKKSSKTSPKTSGKDRDKGKSSGKSSKARSGGSKSRDP